VGKITIIIIKIILNLCESNLELIEYPVKILAF
jgi:hypothetical protein